MSLSYFCKVGLSSPLNALTATGCSNDGYYKIGSTGGTDRESSEGSMGVTILAYSAYDSPSQRQLNRSMSKAHMDLLESRQLCEDRKGVFDHLQGKRLIKSTIRIVIMQGTQVVTHYFNDQLKEDLRRDEMVEKGKLTNYEAEKQADAWAEREWNKRMEDFPKRLGVAFAKYHSIILVMRFYEHIASQIVDKFTLDKLTIDTFESAKRSHRSGKSGRELASDVYSTCMKANLISYLADYTVHQIILTFGYVMYIRERRKRRQKSLSTDGEGDAGDLHGGSLALSLTKNSTLLFISRGVGLVLSSIGGGIGAMVTPGWGSLAGANLGDGLAMALSDEIINPSPPIPT